MLVRIVSRRYAFTAAGDFGDVSVYDSAGRMVASSLASPAEAEAWCDRHTLNLPPREDLPRREPEPRGRDSRTGY